MSTCEFQRKGQPDESERQVKELVVREQMRVMESQSIADKESLMRIALPLAEGKLCMHFGHCETFALVEADPASKKILRTTRLEPPEHQPGLFPRWLHEQGATVVIAGGMGQRAQGLFAENGIQVVVGAPADTPETLVLAFLNGTLKTGDNVCDH